MAKKAVRAKSSRSASRSSAKVRSVKNRGVQFNSSLFPLVGIILAIIALIAIVFASNQKLGFNTKADDTARINCQKTEAQISQAETAVYYGGADKEIQACMDEFTATYSDTCSSDNIVAWNNEKKSTATAVKMYKSAADTSRAQYNKCVNLCQSTYSAGPQRDACMANSCKPLYDSFDANNTLYVGARTKSESLNTMQLKCNKCLMIKSNWDESLRALQERYDANNCEFILHGINDKNIDVSKKNPAPNKASGEGKPPSKPVQKGDYQYDYVCGNENGAYVDGTPCSEEYVEGTKICHKYGTCDGKNGLGRNCRWGTGSYCKEQTNAPTKTTMGQPSQETNSSTVCKGRAKDTACYERYAEGDKFCYKFGQCDGEGDDGTHCSWGPGSYCK